MQREEKRTPATRPETTKPADPSSRGEIDAFLAQARLIAPAGTGQGRLIMALDATMSRQPTWDVACKLQAEMFEEAGRIGNLDIQLVYFRGFGECRASRWMRDGKTLSRLMVGIRCLGGQTQIGKVLAHARREAAKDKVAVLVYVGDALEEPIDELAAKAGELGMLGVRVFIFQEGRNAAVERGFREIARLTGGAYARFDTNAAGQLRELLRAAAAFAVGGVKALANRGGRGGRLLLEQMR